LEHGANLFDKTNSGDTPLHSAAQAAAAVAADQAEKHFKCCYQLEKDAAEKPEDYSKSNCIALLLEHGVDPSSENEEGLTPLALAVGAGHEDVVNTLLDRTPSKVYSSAAYVKLLKACAAGDTATAKILETISVEIQAIQSVEW
jgi:ankyrin repeat protein